MSSATPSVYQAYRPVKPARSVRVPIRTVSYHVLEWGRPGAPLLFLFHGWMDVAASWQFVVDALAGDRHVIAADWRGFGGTLSPQDSYWMPDYQADIDALLRHYSPDAPADIVGHSLGGNVTTLYAGVRPERVRRLVNLEGLGLAGLSAEEAPLRMAQWLDQMAKPPTLSTYASLDEVAARLMRNNPRLSAERAHFVAPHWAEPGADGRYVLRASPAHKIINPYIYRADEAAATWARITAPVLWVTARESGHVERFTNVPGYAERVARIRDRRHVWVEEAGHMLHHDQPERVATLIEEFLAD